jgi:hypothetical protein
MAAVGVEDNGLTNEWGDRANERAAAGCGSMVASNKCDDGKDSEGANELSTALLAKGYNFH